jgi:hypothetical protein
MELVKITEGFATRFSDFAAGQVLRITGKVPAIIAAHSEKFNGPAPPSVTDLDAPAFERVHRKRATPTPDASVTKAEICRLFDWDDHQFEAAQALNFPVSTFRMQWNSFMGAPKSGYKIWTASEVQAWAHLVTSLGLRP